MEGTSISFTIIIRARLAIYLTSREFCPHIQGLGFAIIFNQQDEMIPIMISQREGDQNTSAKAN